MMPRSQLADLSTETGNGSPRALIEVAGPGDCQNQHCSASAAAAAAAAAVVKAAAAIAASTSEHYYQLSS